MNANNSNRNRCHYIKDINLQANLNNNLNKHTMDYLVHLGDHLF